MTNLAGEPVPTELADLIACCLEKDPARRPQSATELVTLLDALAARHPWTNGDARAWWEANDARATPASPESPQKQALAAE